MNLNYDCVRDVLISLEERIIIDEDLMIHGLGFDALCECNEKYSKGELLYTVLKLVEGDYIRILGDIEILPDLECKYNANYIIISDITFKGHQYLDSIRDSKIWNSVKGKVSSLTFSVISAAATKLITSAI